MRRRQGCCELHDVWKLYYYGHQPGAEPLTLPSGLEVSQFSSDTGAWIDAPAWGVQGLAVLSDTTGYYRNTNDFYIIPPWASQPFGCDHWGLMDYLLWIQALDPSERLTSKTPEFLEAAGVKFGRSLDDDVWRKVLTWMANDPELPHKSAREPHERP